MGAVVTGTGHAEPTGLLVGDGEAGDGEAVAPIFKCLKARYSPAPIRAAPIPNKAMFLLSINRIAIIDLKNLREPSKKAPTFTELEEGRV